MDVCEEFCRSIVLLLVENCAGYWFDKGLLEKTLSCDATGHWFPVSPARLQCRPVYCDEVPSFVGAITEGSDNSAGGRIV